QLLTNLITNAIKFTETGSVVVRAGVHPERPEPRVVCEIEDTGIGIDAKHLERIFQPFNQADNSITRKFGGTGLGLAICRHIVEELGGDISVESVPGRGSKFRITLESGPLEGVTMLESARCEAVRPGRNPPGMPLTRQTLPPIRVLLVEDGETNR